MNFIDKIKKPILPEMQEFDDLYQIVLDNDNALLNNVYNYVIKGSGKKLRPIITLLAAKLLGKINNETLYGAFSLELLHTASLIHDDVVDDTLERRGRESVNARWTNKIAVLSGDYVLSKSLHCACATQNLDIVGTISEIGMTLTDGELMQLKVQNPTTMDEESYFNIIKRKTAHLFAACMEVGGLSVRASESERASLIRFGNALGICFQIKDDIFDYYEDANIGKPTGNDVRDGKLTLPLIYALRTSCAPEKDEIIRMIENKEFTHENIQRIMNFAHSEGGLDYARKIMNEYNERAMKELQNFPDNEAKQALIDCVEFVSSRNF